MEVRENRLTNFTACEQLYTSKNIWAALKAGNQGLIFLSCEELFLTYCTLSESYNTSSMANISLSWQEKESKHLVQLPLAGGGLREVGQLLPTTHKELQVENHALEKARKEQKARMCCQ